MEKEWFELSDVRRRTLNDAVWIPLRASEDNSAGQYGFAGHRSESFCAGSLAVPLAQRKQAEVLRWMDLGLFHDHSGYVQDGRYIPSDVYEGAEITGAIPLVLSQAGNSEEPVSWHLHQDLVVTLRLKREGNVWLAMDEGYVEVARLRIGKRQRPEVLEIRAEYLKDYLCARAMALYVSWYRRRLEVVEQPCSFGWPENSGDDPREKNRWVGWVREIHEGGHPYGSSAAVMHVGRKNIDPSVDVPKIGPSDDGIVTESWTKTFEGRKLYTVCGEMWHNEWVEPGSQSPRIRGDELPPSVFFITDASGKKESQETLRVSGRWLWFRPEVMMALAHRRGGRIAWYTRDTGRVKCSPDGGVVFGVNKLGIVNVYAKDIGLLPEWQQRQWAGFNVAPEAGVSEELLSSQAAGVPARTKAPEPFIERGIELLNEVSRRRLGFSLFLEHDQFSLLLPRVHRFRSVDAEGLFSLAKDVARLTADAIDAVSLQKIVKPPQGEKWGSLKSLEKVIATKLGADKARKILSPLVGAYELRHADAHLPSEDLADSFALASIDTTQPFVFQGYQLLRSCVTSIHEIASALDTP